MPGTAGAPAYWVPMIKRHRPTTVSLVLGSGGARGLAHIGVIRWLEENGYEIRSIAGASMGALVGGIHAAGRLREYEDWVRAVTRLDIVTLLDLSWGRGGLVKGDRIINTLRGLVGDLHIEDLPLRFTAVAVDIRREREVWLQSGRLFDAIRASISLPLVFTPFRLGGVELIDGGVLNPVPIAPTFGDGTDLTVAVNLAGPAEHDGREAAPAPPRKPDAGSQQLHDRVVRFVDSLRDSLVRREGQERDMYDIANDAVDAMQGAIARQKLAAYPPDVVVEIPRNVCGMFEFDRAAELIALGHARAARRLGERGPDRP